MKYYKDLHPQPESNKFHLILGILFIILSIALIITNFVEDGFLTIFNWFYSFILFLNGVVILLQYRGINIDRIFGKKFIRVTPEQICYKPTHRSKEQIVNWKEVEAIKFNIYSVDIISHSHTLNISYQSQSFQDIQLFKQTILQSAEQKSIPVQHKNQ
ncbi:MAG: hypothetical protein PWP52_617 [Bacteroidales bacterium]|jgi:hypothetical protein|nr:hypothetical protein [Bacteroidales bacterium]